YGNIDGVAVVGVPRRRSAYAGHYPGHHADQRSGVPAVEWQLLNILLLDYLRERSRLRVDHLRIGRDRYRLADRADREPHIQRGRGVHVQSDAGLPVSVEAARRHLDAVQADWNLAEKIAAVGLRLDHALEARLHTDQLDVRGGD